MMPLDDIRVLDLTRLMPGYTTTILADMGADVVKVEEPGKGDWFRQLGPKARNGEAYAFLMVHRNKRALTINLKAPEGKHILRRLVAEADVLVESFRPGVMERLGLGYTDLSAINPRLIYCAISGFGQSGPYRNIPGHDANYVAITGLASLSSGVPAHAPQELPTPLADFDACQRAVIGILGALHARSRMGRGQFIDIAMMEGVPTWLLQSYSEYFATGQLPNAERFISPGGDHFVGQTPGYGFYAAADGWLALGAAEPAFWEGLCLAIGLPDIAPLRARGKGAAADAALRNALRTRTMAEWTPTFDEYDVPYARINDLSAATSDPHMVHRGVFVEVEHPRAGRIRQIASPIRLAGNASPDHRPAPTLGEHTDEVLRECRFSDTEISDYRARGIV